MLTVSTAEPAGRETMEYQELIQKRRAYRSLEPVEMSLSMVRNLGESASLAPSCFNNQPWRFVFVYGDEQLVRLKETLSRGNAWAQEASMIVAVVSLEKLDCVLGDRVYNLFDTGMATAFLILRATELGLVCHPIAGYDPKKVKEVLEIPEKMSVITLLVVGKHASLSSPHLSEKQQASEGERPPRLSFQEFCYLDRYCEEN